MKKYKTTRWLAVMVLAAICIAGSCPAQVSALSKPSLSVSKRTKTKATIKITKVKAATGYQVFLATSKKGKYQQIGATRTTSFQISKIKKDKTYYVKVRSYKTTGSRIVTSGYSAAVQIGKYSAETKADKYAKQVLELVNKERAGGNLDALQLSKELNEAASVRAKELASEFSHIRPDGRDCFTALIDAGIVYSCVGENIAAGQTSPEAVMKSWMNSDGHRANIMSTDYTQMGVGYYYDAKEEQHYWVQIFIKE